LVESAPDLSRAVVHEPWRPVVQRGRAPHGLIISGCHAPHLHSERQLSHRDDADFIAELIDIVGCSPVVFLIY
ncbi:thioesterase domain-containing protein, partial [Klebsiella pneumoniae]